ncbi:hypothetical protein LTR48_005007 [Friedmanniomyces endolithicus]|nr:hypothetical protein LTR48_005007 [Friedmanniomyces endolithicus]
MSTEVSEGFRVDGTVSIPDLHRDLARKYRNVGSKVEDIWRAFNPRQREKALRESTGDGKVLNHSRDPGLAGLRCFIPEYNIRDMTTTPEHFLDIFRYRSTAPLVKQFCVGVNDGPGDRETIEKFITAYDLRHPKHKVFAKEVTTFLEGDRYGQSYQTESAAAAREMIAVAPTVCVPRSKGELIITRQTYLLQFLNHLVEEVLDLGSDSRAKDAPPKKKSEAVTTAMSKLDVQPRPQKMSISDIISDHAVQNMYYSRPELVPDDKGRVLPVMTDEYLSVALLDSVNNAIRGIATWEYVGRLLAMVEGLTDKAKRPLILQELTNVCHMEYRRAQGIFKRQLSLAPGFASKKFRRTPNPNYHTQWKITMKGRPEDCTVTDPYLHYVLRLCHPDTSPAAAVQWIQKLDDHNARHQQDRERMHENQITAFGDLTIIVSFMHSMSTSIALTPISR